MSLALFALLFLIACWLLWTYPFVRQRLAGPKRDSVVMAPAARWGIVLESVGYFLVWIYTPGNWPPGLARIVASMVAGAVSTVFVWWALRHLGRQWRILAGLYDDHQLIRTGPYAIVRHPIYASMFGMLLATGLIFAPWWRFALAIAVFLAGNEIRIHAEESLLRERFGPAFEEYRGKVAAYLPFVR